MITVKHTTNTVSEGPIGVNWEEETNNVLVFSQYGSIRMDRDTAHVLFALLSEVPPGDPDLEKDTSRF